MQPCSLRKLLRLGRRRAQVRLTNWHHSVRRLQRDRLVAGVSSNTRAFQRSIGNQATLRLLAQRASSLTGNELHGDHYQDSAPENKTARETLRGPLWDFSKIPIFPPYRPNGRQAGPPLFAPPSPCVSQPKLDDGQPAPSGPASALPEAASAPPTTDAEASAAPRRRVAQAALATPLHAVVQKVTSSPGQMLDAPARRYLEPRFGHDFSKVRVQMGLST